MLDKCPGGDYAGFSHTYVIEENVVETEEGKMVEKEERDTLAHCATVEEKARFEIVKFFMLTLPFFFSGLGLRVLTSQPGVCLSHILCMRRLQSAIENLL